MKRRLESPDNSTILQEIKGLVASRNIASYTQLIDTLFDHTNYEPVNLFLSEMGSAKEMEFYNHILTKDFLKLDLQRVGHKLCKSSLYLGNLSIFETLLAHGVKINTLILDYFIHAAAEGGHINAIDHLVSNHHANINAKTPTYGAMPIHIAAKHGHIGMVDHLVKHHNVDPHARTNNGLTLIYFAIGSGHIQMVEHLVKQYKLNINPTNQHGGTILHFAALFHQWELFEKYLPLFPNADFSTIDSERIRFKAENLFFSHKFKQILEPKPEQFTEMSGLKSTMETDDC